MDVVLETEIIQYKKLTQKKALNTKSWERVSCGFFSLFDVVVVGGVEEINMGRREGSVKVLLLCPQAYDGKGSKGGLGQHGR